uniref:Golgi-associated plant pathogenesis-related protein 1 n=1 Tax=Cacopsylla melanoneura TaxID=428564 RepID=A0A8D9ELG5_9HEMI
MWLSTILVLTHGLLLVHYVSLVSCLNNQWGDPVMPRSITFQRTPSAVGSERLMRSMTSDEVQKQFGTKIGVREEDDIERAVKALKQINRPISHQLPTYDTPRVMTSDEVLKRYNSFQVGSTPSAWNSIVLKRPATEPSAPSYSRRLPTVSPLPPTVSPILPTVSPTQPTESPYSAMQSRTRSRRGLVSGFSSTGSSSDLYPGESNVPQNPSLGKSIPNVLGVPSTQSLPSTSSASNIGAQTNGMHNSPQPIQNTSTAPVKKQYTYAKDGRRLAGRQTESWPKMDGPYKIKNAGPKLGETFKGILIPEEYIGLIKREIKNAKERSKLDNHGHANVGNFQLQPAPEAYNIMDVKLIQQAIREALGDDDDWDNPDPWTNATIYSDEVLELNKKLHDEYRARHYAQPLEYMDAIHPVAHAYATKLAELVSLGGKDYFDHNYEVLEKKRWSENLYTEESDFDGKSPAKLVKLAIDGWYEEVNRYNYFGQKTANILEPLTGHFTCLVWRGSQRMGLGIAKYTNNDKKKTQYVVVVNYDPAGNIEDSFDTNVIRQGEYKDRMNELPPPYPSASGQENPRAGGAIGGLLGF